MSVDHLAPPGAGQHEDAERPPASAKREDGPTRPAIRYPRPSKASRRRRGFEIHAYVGPNGGGKTLCAVRDTLPSLAAGRPVLSTVPFLDPMSVLDGEPEPHPLWVPLTTWRQMLDFEGGDIVMDEVTGIASSRDAMSLPGEVALKWQQLRKADCLLRWTAPAWARADTIIRSCTRAVTLCYGYRPQQVKGEDRMWSARRLFYWRSYDAVGFEEFEADKRKKLKPFARELYWRPGKIEERSYDTYAQVLRLTTITEHGTCMDCAGRKNRPPCKCDEVNEARAPRRRTRSAAE